ncbi:MAG: hypothetical protein ABSG01_08895 [Anaerolineales bacterium]|jgi:hypothetical protein
MIDKIYDATDKALEEHVLLGFPYTDLRGRILFHSTRLGCQWTGAVAGTPVEACVDAGRWLAKCDGCGGMEYVTPSDPIFFCHSCGNLANKRAARPVIFPPDEERKTIETALLKRGVTPGLAIGPIDQTRLSTPDVPGLLRSWQPGENADELQAQTSSLTAAHQTAQPAPVQPAGEEVTP